MNTLRSMVSLNITLGFVSAIGLALQYFALADIARQEADPTLEWRIVGLSMIMPAIFVILTIVSLVRLYRFTDEHQHVPRGQ